MELTSRLIKRLAAGVALALHASLAGAAPVVWSGFDVSFTRPNDVDWSDPLYRDVMTPQTAPTRGDTRGVFNIAIESAYDNDSPANTRWATNLVPGNAGKEIAAANWSQLNFLSWRAAYGDAGTLGTAILTRDAVVHLVAEDIYLDLRFTGWTQRGGGGFAYLRAQNPNRLPGDFNGDGAVNGADLAAWSAGFGSTNASQSQGDADGDGDVDGVDFLSWQRSLTPAPIRHVPEGSSAAALAYFFAVLVALRSSGESDRSHAASLACDSLANLRAARATSTTTVT